MLQAESFGSLLYRRQILQQNIRWKALDEIYKMRMRMHRSDLNIQQNVVKLFRTSRSILKKVDVFD